MKTETPTLEAPSASSAASLPLDLLRNIAAEWRMSNFTSAGVNGFVLCRQTVAGWLAYGWLPDLWEISGVRLGDVAVPAHKHAAAHVLGQDRAGVIGWEVAK